MRTAPAAARVGLLAALVVAVPRAVRTVLTYAPELLPARIVRGPDDLAVSSLSGIHEPFPDPLGYDPPSGALPVLADYLGAHGAARGRILTDDPAVAGFLALRTPLAVLGPLAERGAPASAADPSPLLASNADSGALRAFIERYGVTLVVLGGPSGPLDGAVAGLAPTTVVEGYRVRAVVAPSGLVATGTARVDATALGSIRVGGAGGGRVTLRYHFAPGLSCRPGCSVERAEVPGDPAGFVTVANAPARFEITSP